MTSCIRAENAQMDEWLTGAQFDAEHTPDELYEQALAEDTLIVYSTTTRIYEVKDSFEKQYPGLTVEVYDTRAHDLVEILKTSYETGEVLCDVVICSDDTGVLSGELLPQGIINKYVPYDIAPNLNEVANAELLSFVIETEQLFYNPNIYDERPIDNWWELTEPQWQGKVYMNSPLRSYPAYALVHAVITNEEEMRNAYFDRYGETLSQEKSAGKEFWERMFDNDIQFTTSSNELVEIVGNDPHGEGRLAFMISSKIRRTDVGLEVAVCYGATPSDGVYSSNTVSITGGAKNINSAKLFTRWLLGETDGDGEGLTPYLLEGTWPVRTDIRDYSSVPLSQGNYWYNNKQEVTQNEEDILEFWTRLQSLEQ